jgi:HPt (histidine-containing phosphotransfer) domain-containing protein
MGRVAVLEAAVAAAAGGGLDTTTRREAEGEAHKLAGSLGMFGYHTGTDIARDIETMLEGDGPVGPELAALVARLVDELPPR